MSNAGRPTVMTPETVNKLEQGFTMGFTDEEACLYANISKQTLYDYCKKHLEYTDRKEGLKNHPKLLAKINIYNALKNNEKVDDSKWYAERKMKKEFGANVDITTEGKQLPQSIINLDKYAIQGNECNPEYNTAKKED